MPRYFFHISGDETLEDSDGVDFRDDIEARRAGAIALGELARENLPDVGPRCSVVMIIRSDRGEKVAELSLSFAMDAAAP